MACSQGHWELLTARDANKRFFGQAVSHSVRITLDAIIVSSQYIALLEGPIATDIWQAAVWLFHEIVYAFACYRKHAKYRTLTEIIILMAGLEANL